MSTNDKSGKSSEEKPKKTGVVDFLSGPRRKRKSFVVLACSPNISSDLKSAVESMIRSAYKGMGLSIPNNVEEFVRNFSRQIALLIYDDEFAELSVSLEMIRTLKEQRHEDLPPVLFLTRQPSLLIDAYHKQLGVYHEMDDYIDYSRVSVAHILSRVRTALATKNRRRSRRYKVDLPIEYFDSETKFEPHRDNLDELGVVLRHDPQSGGDIEINPITNSKIEKGKIGRLIDLSLHGGLLRAEDGGVFRIGDQFKIKIRLAGQLPSLDSEFLKFSARIHRVQIGGDIAAFRFQNLSESQLNLLTRFLTDLVNKQSIRRIQQIRMRNLAAK